MNDQLGISLKEERYLGSSEFGSLRLSGHCSRYLSYPSPDHTAPPLSQTLNMTPSVTQRRWAQLGSRRRTPATEEVRAFFEAATMRVHRYLELRGKMRCTRGCCPFAMKVHATSQRSEQRGRWRWMREGSKQHLEIVKQSDDKSRIRRKQNVFLSHCMLHLLRFDDAVLADHLQCPDLLVAFVHHKEHLPERTADLKQQQCIIMVGGQ